MYFETDQGPNMRVGGLDLACENADIDKYLIKIMEHDF